MSMLSEINENDLDDEDQEEYDENLDKIEDYSFGDSDPKGDSGFFGSLFFYWGYQIIRLASLTQLNLSNLGTVNKKHSVSHYSKRIFDNWAIYKGKNHGLIKTVIKSNQRSLIIVVFLSVVSCCLNLYEVNLFNSFLSTYRKEVSDAAKEIEKIQILIIISTKYLVIKLVMILLNRKLIEYQNTSGYKAGIQLDALVFDKILKTNLTDENHSTISDIVNYIQIDSLKLTTTLLSSPNVITIPFLIIGYSYMLFTYFGFSFLIGFSTLVIFLFINFSFQNKYKVALNQLRMNKDKTLKMVLDTLNHIKSIKINGWEEEFLERIRDTKETEAKSLMRRNFFANINQSILWCAPVAISTVTIGFAQYFNKGIDIGDVFTCLKIFAQIEEPIRGLTGMLGSFYITFVSLTRIEQFLLQENYNDSYIIRNDEETKDQGILIKIENGSFSWGKNINVEVRKESFVGSRTQSYQSEIALTHPLAINDSSINDPELGNKLLYGNSESFDANDNNYVVCDYVEKAPVIKNINLTILNNEFICILGETGSGKSSVLEAILGNMKSTNPDSSIIINGSISYISQVPWISNNTVKQNIVFNYPFDEERYNQVVKICKLEEDFDALVGGDSTEIGENGINISGGQKSRISLARGLYADKDIYIFDEPTAAIDAKVGLSIIKKGLSTFLIGKTRILVTQTVEYAAFADRILYMKGGEIIWEGNFEEFSNQSFSRKFNLNERKTQMVLETSEKVKTRNSVLFDSNTICRVSTLNTSLDCRPTLFNVNETTTNNNDIISAQSSNVESETIIRTTQDEELLRGKIQKSMLKEASNYLGGYRLLFLLALIVIEWQLTKNGASFWIFYWGDHQSPSYNYEYFIVYASFGIVGGIFTFMKNKVTTASVGRTTKNLHLDMIYHLIRAPLPSFHDITPKGQIINRLSLDIITIEEYFYQSYSSMITFLTAFIYGVIMCSIYQPFCLLLIPLLGIIGSVLTKFYLNCSLDLTRLESNTRSPILNIVNETCLGSSTIRSHNYNEIYRDLFYKKIDDVFKVRLAIIGTFQWYGLILDFLSFFLEIFLIFFSLSFMDNYRYNLDIIALLLSYSTSLQSTLSKFLIDISSFESTMIAMERCLKYASLPKESASKKYNDFQLRQWPSKGRIAFRQFTMQYRPHGKKLLDNISFEIKPGEKVGIVGRTGSGKSTITLSLGRIVEATSGTIYIDGIDIKNVGLKKLRNSLTIISQDLSLFEGTLRYNIDPLMKHSDKEIKKAMKKVNCLYLCEQSNNGLDQIVTENGMNYSMSEKQLIFATRALLNKTKVLILDEFTSSLDYKSEELVYKVLIENFKNSTIIIIAHRIKTIMNCDKVLVLNNGKVSEFDSPIVLKNKKSSLFYKLCQKSYI